MALIQQKSISSSYHRTGQVNSWWWAEADMEGRVHEVFMGQAWKRCASFLRCLWLELSHMTTTNCKGGWEIKPGWGPRSRGEFAFWWASTSFWCECKCCCLVTKSRPTLLRPHWLYPARLLCPCDFPGKNTGLSCHFLIQGTFLIQGSNLVSFTAGSLVNCKWILYYWDTQTTAKYKSCPNDENHLGY